MSKVATHALGPPSSEEELAFRLCGTARRRAADREAIERLALGADPDRLLAFLRRQRLGALIGTRLEELLPGAMTDSFGASVAGEVTYNRHRGLLYKHMGRRLCELLEDSGIPVVTLKGVEMAERIHGDLGLRSSPSDVDLLVAPEHLQDAVQVLAANDFEVRDNVVWADGLPHYHSLLVTRQPIETWVEPHWRVHWYERQFAQDMLARSGVSSEGGRSLRPEDEFVSLLLIFARDGYFGLRLPADIAAWWDTHGQALPAAHLDSVIEDYPRLRNPLLAAIDVLERETGLPAAEMASSAKARPRRTRTARRLVNWTTRGSADDIATNITLNDLLLTPWGAFRVFFRHYYFQPLGHYAREYGWPQQQRFRNRVRRAYHIVGRLGRSAGKYARRLWQVRGGRSWEPLPAPPEARRRPAASPPAEPRVLIVSPVRNEAAHIERVVRSVAAQTQPPDLWLVADDGSDDGTLATLRSLEPEVPFLQVVEIQAARVNGKDRLAQALEVRAFNRALSQTDPASYTHVGKLDGDIELPPDYFERIIEQMGRNPRLGICGGSIVEPTGIGGSWKGIAAPNEHVHGALKLFTRECFEALGGIQERLGWDTIDETYARMYGFETQRNLELIAKHHRPAASADGKLRGRMRHGQCAYIARYSLPWVVGRSFKIGVIWDPRGVSGLAFLWGYLACALRRADRVEDEEFKRFVRDEQRRRLRRGLGLDRREVTECTTSA